MIIIIHGDDVTQSTRKLDSISKDWTVRLDAKKALVDEIERGFQTDSLFDEKRTIMIEHVESARKEILESLIKNAETLDSHNTLIIYSTLSIHARILKRFSTAQIFEFKLPKVYFNFLDGIIPGNGRNIHVLIEELSSTYTAEQLFYSVVKRIRQLLMMKTMHYQSFDEIAKMNSWQITKIKKQAHSWEREELVQLYKQLYKLEKGMKTSTLPASLLSHLDIALITAL